MKLIPTRGAVLALSAAAAAMALSACVPVALVGGAVGAGTLLATADRRSGDTAEADRSIDAAANERVVQALNGRGHVNLASYYRKVLITGEVPNAQDKQLVEAQVRAVPGVQGVYNELAVMPNSGPVDRSNDAYITSKVRSRLVGTNGVPAGSIRVVTERGTTYLMGRLTAQEMALATDVAAGTDGVQRVVRIIDVATDPAGGQGGTAVGSGLASEAPAQARQVSGSESVSGVVTSPVTQPTIVSAPKPIEVQTLPPVK